jgi:ribosome maturation factor RimP
MSRFASVRFGSSGAGTWAVAHVFSCQCLGKCVDECLGQCLYCFFERLEVRLNRDTQIAAIHDLVTPVLASLGLELFDLQLTGSGRGRTLRISVEREGGVDLDAIAGASQAITPLLDNDKSLDGSYLLEVTSPGIERPLRRPEHFRRAIGEIVSIKYRTDTTADRLRGTLTEVDDDGCVVDVDGELRHFAFADIADARTVFEWGPAPRPGKAGKGRRTDRTKEKSRS